MSILYPVASSADQALNAPAGRAEREREARRVADRVLKGAEVRFVVEDAGPVFPSREAAQAAYAGRLEGGWCGLREIMAPVKGRKPYLTPVRPTFQDGRRWPAAPLALETQWRLSVSYWKVIDPEAEAVEPAGQARRARRDPEAQALEPDALRALTRQPMRAFKPQQPLDIGLFETRAPENPNLVLPDE